MITSPIHITDGMIHVGNRIVPLLAGEVQFWRMQASEWPAALDRVVELGIPIVSSYLSWRRHEAIEGTFTWGEENPALDARAFIQMCADRGLLVQLKPGPWICAEEPGGGYPDWIMADADELAIGAGGKPIVGYNPPFLHPVPSTSSQRYRDAAGVWLREVWRELGDLQYPNGPIFAVQLDNEPSLAFQDAMYFADYHPATVARFGPWLADRYGNDLAAWQAAWGAAAGTDFADAKPPRPSTHTPAGVELIGLVTAPTPPSRAADHDWTAFLEFVLVEHLEYLRAIHVELGAGHLLPTVNIINHPVHEAPITHAGIRSGIDAPSSVGVDHYYQPPLTWESVDRLARTAATARVAGEPIVWAPELMAGIWRSPGEVIDYPDPTPAEEEAWWGASIALGYGGFNLYMLVNRENWEHAPVDQDGALTGFARAVATLTGISERNPSLLQARPRNRVSVLWHQADAYDAYSVVGTMRQTDVPWHDAEKYRAYANLTAVQEEILQLGHGYDYWDPRLQEAPATDVLVIVEPTSAPLEIRERAARAGVTVLTVSDPPEMATALAPFAPWARAHAEGAEAFAALADAPDGSTYLHVVAWGDEPTTVEVALENGTWSDLIDGSTLTAAAGALRVPGFLGHRIYRSI